MRNYNDLKKQWNQRNIPRIPGSGVDILFKKVKFLRSKQIGVLVILALTVIVLLYFFFYITAYRNRHAFIGLSVMILSVAIRILIEFIYMIRKDHWSIDHDVHAFNESLLRYYKSRKFIHLIITPVIFLGYIIGFLILMPAFRQNLSPSFYQYVLYSSWFIFAGLAALIFTQVRKELRILREISRFSI